MPGSDSMVHQPSSLSSLLLVEEVAMVSGELREPLPSNLLGRAVRPVCPSYAEDSTVVRSTQSIRMMANLKAKEVLSKHK